MKIAIIGAGWVGCHLAKVLAPTHTVKLFDYSGIFSCTSLYNQNRLHLGFHYPRNYKTRNLCSTTFSNFLQTYPNLVKKIDRNVYSIPTNSSLIDLNTYLSIFKSEVIPFSETVCDSLRDVEGSINTDELLIDTRAAREYFISLHKNALNCERITLDNITQLKREYDFVINCTNNLLKDNTTSAYYELSLSLVYRKKHNTDFGALTVVDGNFFSIFPYHDELYTVTSVEHTPLFLSNSAEDILEAKRRTSESDIESIRQKIIKVVERHYPKFLYDFEYDSYFTSIKSKVLSNSADRYPVITKTNNLINCFTGKIQGIFAIEKAVTEHISL